MVQIILELFVRLPYYLLVPICIPGWPKSTTQGSQPWSIADPFRCEDLQCTLN